MIRSVSVYCGARRGANPRFLETASHVGTTLAKAGIRVIYGGSRAGMMGALADATMAAGGTVTGVIPAGLERAEIRHPAVEDMRIVSGMHERKSVFTTEADAFLVLPGGIGTLDELFEAWTWGYLGIHQKVIGILNVDDFYTPLRTFLDGAGSAGLIDAPAFDRLLWGADIETLLESMQLWEPTGLPLWRASMDR
jgi:hypothetical protein